MLFYKAQRGATAVISRAPRVLEKNVRGRITVTLPKPVQHVAEAVPNSRATYSFSAPSQMRLSKMECVAGVSMITNA